MEAANESIERIEQESSAIVLKSKEIAAVQDAESEARAAEFLKQVKLRLDQVKDARMGLTKPLKDHIKKLEGEFNRVAEPLEQADRIVRDGMTAYRNSQTFKEAEARRIELEAQARAAATRGDVQAVIGLQEAHANAATAAPRKIETQSGEARFRKVWKYEITDIEKIPAEYWIPDEKKITATVKAGVTIPGVKAWQEDTPVIM